MYILKAFEHVAVIQLIQGSDLSQNRLTNDQY
jgi:hypothetical protein